MAFGDDFTLWPQLTEAQRQLLRSTAQPRQVEAGTLLHNGAEDCVGLFVVRSGQLRTYILSEQGREVTLFRLLEGDVCLFSASCMIHSIQFDVAVEAEKPTDLWIIPPEVYQKLMESSAAVANYTNQLMASRFSEVMWLVEQILWQRFDARLAAFLLEESNLEDNLALALTHERIAAHLGTAREVVTRMLRYFQSEGWVTLSRGGITLTDPERLRALAA